MDRSQSSLVGKDIGCERLDRIDGGGRDIDRTQTSKMRLCLDGKQLRRGRDMWHRVMQMLIMLMLLLRMVSLDVDPGEACLCLGELVNTAEFMTFEAGSPLELAGAMHTGVGFLAGVTAPVSFEV